MPDTLWVKIRDVLLLSWHAVVAVNGTRCGRKAEGSIEDVLSRTVTDLPLGEKSCETCLRLVAHDQEKAGA
jgi:hypothetical protein